MTKIQITMSEKQAEEIAYDLYGGLAGDVFIGLMNEMSDKSMVERSGIKIERIIEKESNGEKI